MKKQLLTLLPLLSGFALFAQTASGDYLDINQVRARVNANGMLWSDQANAAFFVPKDSTTSTIYTGGIWVGGLDAGSQLHLAAQTYRQSGNDFFPGPVMNSASYSAATDAQWNNVWKINKTTIDTFLLWFASPSSYPNYTIPAVISSWPANGNTSLGQAAQLAPYFDQNADGIYNPQDGDYPCIKGDQAIYFIFNDDRDVHTETGGTKLGIEVHTLAYAYHVPGSPIDSMVFMNVKVYNRSATTYSDVFLGNFSDVDLGSYNDDYIGTDVAKHAVYAYNGTAVDGQYGASPPAQAIVVLRGPLASPADSIDNNMDGTVDEAGETTSLNRSISYANSFTATGNPVSTADFYDYMDAHWVDGSSLTYGGNGYNGPLNCIYHYPGASDPIGWGTAFVPQAPWSEMTASNIPGDRRILASSGKFDLQPQALVTADYAYVYSRTAGSPAATIAYQSQLIDSAVAWWQTHDQNSCYNTFTGIAQPNVPSTFAIYPNPASENVTIDFVPESQHAFYEIYDATGRVAAKGNMSSAKTSISVSSMERGIYFVRIVDGSQVLTSRFIRQ